MSLLIRYVGCKIKIARAGIFESKLDYQKNELRAKQYFVYKNWCMKTVSILEKLVQDVQNPVQVYSFRGP